MTRVSYTELRQNLRRYLNSAIQTRVPVVVTRRGSKGNVVLLPEDELVGWQETVHLLSSPRNADRLLRSVRRAETESVAERDLLSPNTASNA